MLVEIIQSQTLQDAGIERPLRAGDVVRLSFVVGDALVKNGWARRVPANAEARERAVVRPPETGHRRGRR